RASDDLHPREELGKLLGDVEEGADLIGPARAATRQDEPDLALAHRTEPPSESFRLFRAASRVSRTLTASFSGVNGFAKKSIEPAATPRRSSSSGAKPETKSTLSPGLSRTRCSASSRPCIFGMITSVMMSAMGF